jgi:hypothetical protein
VEHGHAHAVVRGDGDIAWGKVVTDCLAGSPRTLYEGGRIGGSEFLAARWDLIRLAQSNPCRPSVGLQKLLLPRPVCMPRSGRHVQRARSAGKSYILGFGFTDGGVSPLSRKYIAICE